MSRLSRARKKRSVASWKWGARKAGEPAPIAGRRVPASADPSTGADHRITERRATAAPRDAAATAEALGFAIDERSLLR
jgi:hypothetical protein